MKIIFTALIISLLHACAMIYIDPRLPIRTLDAQHLDSALPKDKQRVVFINTLSYLGAPVKITIDGKQAGIIYGYKYLQVYLKRGNHKLELQYWTGLWNSYHKSEFDVLDDEIFFKISKNWKDQPTYTIIKDKNPTEFMHYYQPQYYCSTCN